MSKHARHLLLLGVILGLLAALRFFLGLGLTPGRLPGDLLIAVSEYNVYFPVVTTVIISAIFNLSAYLVYSLIKHYYLAVRHPLAKEIGERASLIR